MDETLTTILSTTVPRRPCGDAYIKFGDDPPVGPILRTSAYNLTIYCPGSVYYSEQILQLPPIDYVRLSISMRATSKFPWATLAVLGVATVRECLAAGIYVSELINKYPSHARELYEVYLKHNGNLRCITGLILRPEYLTECQLHGVLDAIVSIKSRLHYTRKFAGWPGHNAYCSVIARLAYL